jgi:hypothetical protein
MSKVGLILDLIRGSHVMSGKECLGDYHVAAKVRNLLRVKSSNERFAKIKSALHPYRVTVMLLSSDPCQIRIRRNDTGKELVL